MINSPPNMLHWMMILFLSRSLVRQPNTRRFLSELPSPQLISSKSSTTIKRVKQLLKSPKKRREAGLTIVESPKSVLDMLQNPKTAGLVRQILVSEPQWHSVLTQIQDRLDASGCDNGDNRQSPRVTPVTAAVMEDLFDTVTPQGVLAIVRIPDSQTLLEKSQAPTKFPLYLILDGVSDPGNLGTLLRSAAAVGVKAVLTLPGTAEPFSPKALRSATLCQFTVPLFPCSSWAETVDQLQEWHPAQDNTVDVWAATMQHDLPGTAYYNVPWTKGPSALIIGNEGNGLSLDVRTALTSREGNLSIRTVHVPMQASVESLNAASKKEMCRVVVSLRSYGTPCCEAID